MSWDNFVRQIFRRFLHYWTIFLYAGPVGFSYAWRLARVQHQLRCAQACVDREKQNHRAALQGLNDEIRRLVSLQRTLTVAAAQFRRQLDAPPTAGPSSNSAAHSATQTTIVTPTAWPTLNDKF
jgi:hypothetical protein